MLPTKEEYKQIILNKLYQKGIINNEIHEKCSKPEYIQTLPYDNRIKDPQKLQERQKAIKKEIQERQNTIKELKTSQKEQGEKIKEGYDNWIYKLKEFKHKIPGKYDVEEEYYEKQGELINNLNNLIDKAEKYKKTLNNYISTYGAEKDISDEIEEIIWTVKDIEINNINKDQYHYILDSYLYEKDLTEYIDGIYRASDPVLANLRFSIKSDGFKANGNKIKKYNEEINNLNTELDKVNNKLQS